MKNRLLCSLCLIVFLLMSICVMTGGAKFVKELRPSVIEQKIEEKADIRLSGHVYDIDVKEDYQILYLKNNSIIYQNESFEESRIILYDEEKLNIEIGNKVEAAGAVSLFERERNPGNFNQKLYYQKQGIHASVWASEVSIAEDSVDSVRNGLRQFRLQWKEELLSVLGEKDGAILSAMLLAEKSGMDEEIKALYQANGVAHVLAISGLHLSVIGVGLYRIFRRLNGSYLFGGIAGVSFLVLYILMIGMSVSVLRALIMFLFRVGADMTGRHYDAPTALSAAAVVTIIWKPLYLYDGGFWMSYGAVFAIVLILPMFETFLFQGFWASVSINLVTLPVLLFCFYEIPLYSVFLNMLVVPLMTVVLMSGLAGSALCMLFGGAEGIALAVGSAGLGKWFLWICKGIFWVYEECCELLLELPYARIVAGRSEVWQMVVYYVCLLLVIVLCRWNRKETGRNCGERVFGLAAVTLMLLAAVLLMIPAIPKGTVQITMLDVGQGDGIFIRGPEGTTYLIDGGSSDVKKVGQYRIESFLKSQGVGKLDYVFISHGDGDHSSGISEMIERMDIGVSIETIVLPSCDVWDDNLTELARIAMDNGCRVVVMEAGQELVEGEMILRCLAPVDSGEDVTGYKNSAHYEDGNAGSMILSLNYGEFDMLFTGDVEAEGEEILTGILSDEYEDIKWEILKVAHHGSKNSSSDDFLAVSKPAYALISAGRENSYGHPHAETLERLACVGSQVMCTQESGAITVTTDGEKMKVEGYLYK